MGFACGIVGLPNVGKSTLFNALTASEAGRAENFPFCTIEPNSGRVFVPDTRLDELSRIVRTARVIPAQLQFEDIAGLVRGAARGEGLGNRFLGHIREVDAIIHVLRCFGGDEITHVEGDTNPLRDAEIVETELMLADLESVERQADSARKRVRGGDRDNAVLLDALEAALVPLHAGRPARDAVVPSRARLEFDRLRLLSAKPVLYVCNVNEDSAGTGNAFSRSVAAWAGERSSEMVVISAAIEAEIARLANESERSELLASLGLTESGLERLIVAGYRLLDLITFFTAGPKEIRAWTIPYETAASVAAGRIHSDIERGFIAAEIIPYDDYIASSGEQGARLTGKLRLEGRTYAMREGDVAHFRFNV